MIVADTCVVLWLAADPGILSKAAKAAVLAARDNGGIAIADITLYELAWLIQNRRVSVTGSAETFLATVESRFVVLPRRPHGPSHRRDGSRLQPASRYPGQGHPARRSLSGDLVNNANQQQPPAETACR
jgi:hypothetical protein